MPQCGSWIGVEVIYMVEIIEICPEGSTCRISSRCVGGELLTASTATETIAKCLSTLTRSVCATPTIDRPCYPCIFGTPAPTDDTVTVTVAS